MPSDTLRLELGRFGVRVLAMEPGSISIPAVDKTLGNLVHVIRSLPADAHQSYGAPIRSIGRRGCAMEKSGSSPDLVASVFDVRPLKMLGLAGNSLSGE